MTQRRKPNERWICALVEHDCATLCLVQARGTALAAAARTTIGLDRASLESGAEIAELSRFVDDHDARHAPVQVMLVGPSVIVQSLRVPRMSEYRLGRALGTRLRSYAGEVRELSLDWSSDTLAGGDGQRDVVVAGVESDFAGALHEAFRRAGLRVAGMTAAAAAIGTSDVSREVTQLVVCESTSVIQVFRAGRLLACREISVGRGDFIAAYRRPIIAEGQAVTLDEAGARRAVEAVGVPGAETRGAEIAPGIAAFHVAPLLSPVLQKLKKEIEQTIAHSRVAGDAVQAVNVVGLTPIPGLGAHLANDLGADGPLESESESVTAVLRAAANPRAAGHVDLRPPAVRNSERLVRPALLAVAASALTLLHALNSPNEAAAAAGRLKPVEADLRAAERLVSERLAQVHESINSTLADLRERRKLIRMLPPRTEAVGALKELLASAPPEFRLEHVSLEAEGASATVDVAAVYDGRDGAGRAAADWARAVSQGAYFASAEVSEVKQRGEASAVDVSLRARLRGAP